MNDPILNGQELIKHDMPEMKLADDLFQGLYNNTKTATIRAGYRDVFPKQMLQLTAVNDPNHAAFVYVTEVKHIKLRELSDEDAQRDGAADAVEMALALARFYPDITGDSEITVILFDVWDIV